MPLIVPDWPAPATVGAVSSTREGGVSEACWASLNLGAHVGDDTARVAENRRRFAAAAALPAEPVWLDQVHGVTVVDAAVADGPEQGDAAVATRGGVVCAVMTADCLPVLLCDRAGTCVAAVHAGWRGLADGVIEASLGALPVEPAALLAWLGPAIGPTAFEVGDEVRERFVGPDAGAADAFVRRGERWLADLYALARRRLAAAGVTAVFGGGFCTLSENERFFSYRRDGQTGRMATAVWLRP
ncbi:MAG: peptidoglycan editing factor PgeF [Pseudomonadota bacterium]